jgi:hypothetical protein
MESKMSNSTNVEKSKYPKKFDIITKLDNSKKARILFLITLGISGLGVRLYFFPYDVPLFNDSQGYFWYAIDMSILNQLPVGHSLVNNGWSSFLSFIFHLMDSNNFLDYHNMQRFVGVVFSVATIFPVYLLCSRYFKKSYSLLGATLFIFEPRLIQNSFLGTPESMYVFLMALLLFLFLSTNFKKIYLAFGIVALLALARYEGFLMIIPLSVVFFIRFRKQKKDLIKYTICMSIFILILVPMAYLKNETAGQDGFISHIAAAPMHYQAAIQENISTLADFLYLGSINLIKYLGWAQIPSFIIFVPLGIILIFKDIDYKKIIIILSILIMLIPAFYGYSRGFQEIKYLYVLYPIFCVLACFTFKLLVEKFNRKNLIFCAIIGGIVLSSLIFVEWKSMDREHYLETYEILTELSQKEMKINKEFGTYGGEWTYFHWLRLHDVDEFPILKKELPQSKITHTKRPQLYGVDVMKDQKAQEYHNIEIDNLRDYFQVLEKQKITHLLLDEINNTTLINDELRLHLIDIFNHENKYPFLVKEYDSRENGFNYYVKLFKIDYNLYDEWVN